MLSMKKHVLKLGNFIVAPDKTFEPIQNKLNWNQNQKYSKSHGFGQFLVLSDMLGIKKHVLMLENSNF